MSISRFANAPDDKPFHSSGYARAARGDRLGATSPQPFSARARLERNRQAIARYRDSMIAKGHPALRDRAAPSSLSTAHPIATKPPASLADVPTRHTFQEPPRRGYNPYK